MPSLFLTRRIHYSGCVQFAGGTPKRPLSALARCRAPRRGSVDRTDSSHSTVAAATALHAPKRPLVPGSSNGEMEVVEGDIALRRDYFGAI